MEAFVVIVGVIIAIAVQVFKWQEKKDAEVRTYISSGPRIKSVSAQRDWNGFLDARGANAFWSFGNEAADPDWIEVIIGPVESGLTLMPKQYRPGQPAQPVTLPWGTVMSATRGTESQPNAQLGSSLESAAVIKLNLHALGEPGEYPSGELAIIRCFSKTSSMLITEINKHLYGRVATRPAPPTASPDLPPASPRTLPPRPVAPRPPVRPSPASVAGAPVPAPPPMYAPTAAPALSTPAVAPPAPVAPTAPVVSSEPAAVTDESGLVAAEEAVAFDDDASATLEPTSLDALTPGTIEMSSFDAPLDLTAYAADDEAETSAPPLIAAPWPPPVAFVLPDSVKVADEQS